MLLTERYEFVSSTGLELSKCVINGVFEIEWHVSKHSRIKLFLFLFLQQSFHRIKFVITNVFVFSYLRVQRMWAHTLASTIGSYHGRYNWQPDLSLIALLLRAFLLKRKKIATQGRAWTPNTHLSYPNLSPLPLQYHSDPPKFRKI